MTCTAKELARAEKNRQSARDSRQRNKEYIQTLQVANEELRAKVYELEGALAVMREAIRLTVEHLPAPVSVPITAPVTSATLTDHSPTPASLQDSLVPSFGLFQQLDQHRPPSPLPLSFPPPPPQHVKKEITKEETWDIFGTLYSVA